VFELPEQIAMLPLILPGVVGIVFTVILIVCAVEEPHALIAVTEILPPVEPAVVTIEVEVELPDQPEGNDQK
jgi:hypothetical protein